MTQTNKPTSRATEIWKRFVGMFGGDAVERKFGKAPPPEWEAVVSMLKDFEIDRGMRRLVYSGKGHVPTLPEFVKLCRTIGNDDFDEGPPKLAALPNPDDAKYDQWDIAANRHLFNFVMLQGSKRRYFDATQTRILVGFKNAWARDMREGNLDPETGEIKQPGPKEQQEAFEDCIARAEEAMAQKVAA